MTVAERRPLALAAEGRMSRWVALEMRGIFQTYCIILAYYISTFVFFRGIHVVPSIATERRVLTRAGRDHGGRAALSRVALSHNCA